MNDKIDPGAGYRLLNPYEDVLPGDEFPVGSDWKKSSVMPGHPFKPGRGAGTYRRKIEQPLPDPGIGWRLLRPFERVGDGDEFTMDGYTWFRDNLVGMRLGATFSLNPHDDWYPRRRKLSAVGDGWRRIAHGEVLQAGDELYTIEGWVPVIGWRDLPLPTRSQASYRRRVPDEERACEDAWVRLFYFDSAKDAFRSGWLARAEWDRQEVPI